MTIGECATSGNEIADEKVNYLLRVLVPWITQHVVDKENIWEKIHR